MIPADRRIQRITLLLRSKIRERGFTFLRIQQILGWGQSYISQLMTRQKTIRIDHVLAILQVIGVEPSEFFAEVFEPPPIPRTTGDDLRRSQDLTLKALRELQRLLTEKGIIDGDELEVAVGQDHTLH